MKRFILPLLIIFIFISLPAKANDEVKTLLKVLDKSFCVVILGLKNVNLNNLSL